jgi:3-oxoacyl-[acyl-carrier protein] reductase
VTSIRNSNDAMDLKLKDKTCLVTGASRGIGRGIAKVLAAEGAVVAVVARRKNLLDELGEEIVAAGGKRPVIVAEDLTSDGVMERIRYRVLEEFGGRLDVLVNNAGSSRPVPWNATEEQWHEGMRLNFELVRRLTNQFIPTMRGRRFGRIINITGATVLGRLHPTEENRRAFIDANIPIGYFGEPEDMAYLVAFLASPLARYITGEIIHVDGGMHRFAG